jgi:hypothetical protein
MPGRGGVVRGQLGVAVRGAAEQERVVAVEFEMFPLDRARHYVQADATGHDRAAIIGENDPASRARAPRRDLARWARKR